MVKEKVVVKVKEANSDVGHKQTPRGLEVPLQIPIFAKLGVVEDWSNTQEMLEARVSSCMLWKNTYLHHKGIRVE